MQLKVTTDYAIRAILVIADSNDIISSNELSELIGVSPRYTLKILDKLLKAGFVSSKGGAQGGYYLAKKPEEISLFDIIELYEVTCKVNRCLEEDEYCSRHATSFCPVRVFYKEFQEIFDEKMESMTIAKLLKESA